MANGLLQRKWESLLIQNFGNPTLLYLKMAIQCSLPATGPEVSEDSIFTKLP